MKRLILSTIITSLLLVGCKNLFESNDKGVEQLNNIENRWEDMNTLALSTSRIALAHPVGELQNIKRDLDNIEVSECLAPAKKALDSYMNSNISNFLKFMADSDAINFNINNDLVKYFDIKDKCASKNTGSNPKLTAEAVAMKLTIEEEAKREAEIKENAKKAGLTVDEFRTQELIKAIDAASEIIVFEDTLK